MILFDTCAVIYAIDPASPWNVWASGEITRAATTDGGAVNAVIVAEICAGADNPEDVPAELEKLGLQILDLPGRAGVLAGKAHSEYLLRRLSNKQTGPKTPLPDFLIGAHAVLSGYKLVTTDGSRFKTYYPTVELIGP